MRRIFIACKDLEQRYLEQGQTAQQIGRDYGCSSATVIRRLSACGVAIRQSRFAARFVPEQELRRLYLEERLPLLDIARQLGVSHGTISARLQHYGIERRVPIIGKGKLRQLWRCGLSIAAVAQLAGMSTGAVVQAIALAERPEMLCLGSGPPLELRAYLSGLRRCWLLAERSDDEQGGVLAYRQAQDLAQCILFANVFGGHSRTYQIALGKQRWGLIAALPGSWSFLLAAEDRLPNWVRAEPMLLIAFLAALIDGSGKIITVPAPQIEMEVRGRGMLRQIGSGLLQWGLSPEPPQLVHPAPQERWGMRISGAGVGRLLGDLGPHLRHPDRRAELLSLTLEKAD